MNDHVDVANQFFTVLTLLANAAVVGALVLALLAAVSGSGRRLGRAVLDAVGPSARLVAWLVAAVATAGSLYYSEIADFVPCRLCWFQRICMYPLSAILLVGVLLKDRRAGWYAAPFVVVGAPLSLYHWLMERGVFEESSSCSATVPCAVPWFEKLGFVTLAYMAMSGFLLIGTLLVVDARWQRRDAVAEGALSPDGLTVGANGHHGASDDEPGPPPVVEVAT